MIELDKIAIIYPPSAGMEALAHRLARDMKNYRIPRNVREQTGINELSDVKDPWLIILCDPEAPKDPGIGQQINDFTARGLYRHILTLLVEGTPDISFPDALLHEKRPDGTIIHHEPLAANVSGSSGLARNRKLKVERLRLLAPILGVSFDELMNRRRRQRVAIVTAIASVVLILGLAFLATVIQRIRVFRDQNKELAAQYERAEAAASEAQADASEAAASYASLIGEGAAEALQKGDCELALLLCLEMLPEHSQIPEVTDTLAAALALRGGAGYVPVTAVTLPDEEDGSVSENAESEDIESEGTDENADDNSDDSEGTGENTAGSSFGVWDDTISKDTAAEDASAGETLPEDIPAEEAATTLTGPDGQEVLWQGSEITDRETGQLIAALPSEYGMEWHREFSSEGYLLYVYGETHLRVYDPARESLVGTMKSYTYPLSEEDTGFRGPQEEGTGLKSAGLVRCGDILFEYREEETPVPEDLESQIELARTFLAGRTLTEEERALYRLEES